MNKKDFAVLYVDDEEHNLTSFKACFRREYQIHTATSGEEGIEVMRRHNIDLILTDQRMPKMTGIQFLERILPEHPDTIRMILTGFSDVEAIIGAINSGRVLRYITKPWDENDLRVAIENARQLWELHQSNKSLLLTLQKKVEEQERTLKLFMKYVPEAVVEKALHSTDEAMFDGELRHVTLLFCDLRGFTAMSEELSPKEVVAFLNDYYTLMTEVVTRHNGVVNQFVGDEVFAAFGAPLATPDNEKNAVFCALDMVQKLKVLNEKYQARVGSEILVGIGINAGEVVAGNVGSEARIEYHFTGDTVNTGKRIEVLSREHPNAILMSESVYLKTHEVVRTKEFEPIQVKGKKDKIKVYQVLARA